MNYIITCAGLLSFNFFASEVSTDYSHKKDKSSQTAMLFIDNRTTIRHRISFTDQQGSQIEKIVDPQKQITITIKPPTQHKEQSITITELDKIAPHITKHTLRNLSRTRFTIE